MTAPTPNLERLLAWLQDQPEPCGTERASWCAERLAEADAKGQCPDHRWELRADAMVRCRMRHDGLCRVQHTTVDDVRWVVERRETRAAQIGIPRNLWAVLTVNDVPGRLDSTTAVEAVEGFPADGALFLVLSGPAGTGKTCGAASWLWRRRHVQGSLFVRASELRRANWFDRDAVATVFAAPALVLDDLASELRGSDWNCKLDELVCRRDADELVTLATTNLPPEQLRAAVGDRAWDRIVGCGRIVECVGPSLRQKKTTETTP